MTARSEELNSAYLYMQNLDNSGDTLCWRSDVWGEYQELEYGDQERDAALHVIDDIQNNGRQWSIGTGEIDFRVTFHGDCLIKLSPLTRDVGGRVAPVLLLFNAFGKLRVNVLRMILDCEALTHRKLSVEQRELIFQFDRMMRWPAICIAMHIFICSRKYTDD